MTEPQAASHGLPPGVPPGEPPVIRRLPPGVDYTHIKMIVLSLPPPLTTMVWAAKADDPIWAAFRGKPYRTLDRALRKRERAYEGLPAPAATDERQHLLGLRSEFVQQFLGEISHPDRRGVKNKQWMSVRIVNPTRFSPEFRPPELTRLAVVIEVWGPRRGQPKLLDRRVVESGPPPWGDPKVNWVDQDRVNRACTELFRKHFRDLMRKRVGHQWRSHREPVGWPLITQYAVPALYDYLRPFYAVRRYRHYRQIEAEGHYPAQLRRDITDILRCELPHLARELTVERVTAAIQRYVRQAPPERLQGMDLFRVPIPQKKTR